jgi:hypothetical protein
MTDNKRARITKEEAEILKSKNTLTNDEMMALDEFYNGSQDNQVGVGEAFARGLLKGGSWGYVDKLYGGLGAIYNDLKSVFTGDYLENGDVSERDEFGNVISGDGAKDYERIRDEYINKDNALKKSNPIPYGFGNVVGAIGSSFLPGLNTLNAVRVGKGLTRAEKLGVIAKNISKSGVSGGLQGLGYSEGGDVSKDVASGAGLGVGIAAAVPVVGSGYNAAKRFIPGVDDAYSFVNKATAKASGLFGSNADEYLEALNMGTTKRNQARNLDVVKGSKDLLQNLTRAKDNINDVAERLYKKAEKTFRSGVFSNADNIDDMFIVDKNLGNLLPDLNAKVENNGNFYSAVTKNVMSRVNDILSGKGPNPTPYVRYQVLESRRQLDDVLKNKDIFNLSKNDLDVLIPLRKSVNDTLTSFPNGGSFLREADDLWSSKVKQFDKFFNRISKRGEEGLNLTKLKNDLVSSSTRFEEFSDDLLSAKNWLNKLNSSVTDEDNLKEVYKVLNDLDDFKKIIDNTKLLESIKRSDGPTGAGARNMVSAIAAVASNGATLPATPIINPNVFMSIIDSLAKNPNSFANKQIGNVLTNALRSGSRSAAVAHFLLWDKEPEYRQKFLELEKSLNYVD